MTPSRSGLRWLLALVVAVQVSPGRAAELFGPAEVSLHVADDPGAMGVADMNADGFPDLVVAARSGKRVEILEGDGSGGFSAGFSSDLDEEPVALAVGDLNRDGAVDIVVVSAARVETLIGNSSGGFVPGWAGAVGSRLTSVAVADLDGDHDLDLALAERAPGFVGLVLVLEGDGHGGFVESGTIGPLGVGFSPVFVLAVDLEPDGDVDLATADRDGNAVHVVRADGPGVYGTPERIPVGASPRAIVAGDLTGDGAVDLATANRDDNSVSLLAGDGDGGFDAAVGRIDVGAVPSPGPFHAPVWLQAVDLDDDGVDDLVVAKEDANALTPLLADGAGTFTRLADVTVGDRPAAVISADFDRDGAFDLAAVNGGSDSLSVLLGDGIGGFARFPVFAVGAGAASIVAADLDGDGDDDFVTANGTDDSISVLRADGLGRVSSVERYPVGNNPTSVAFGLLDADEHVDLLVVNKFGNAVRALIGAETGEFNPGASVPVGALPESIVAANFDDGDTLDAAVARGDAPNDLVILLGDGNGSLLEGERYVVPDGPTTIVTDRFDVGPALDLVVAARNSEQLTVLLGNGDGTFQRRSFDLGLAGNWGIASGLLDGDDHADLAIANSDSDSVLVLLGDGQGGFDPPSSVPVGIEPTDVAIVDVNADGAQDLLATNSGGKSVSVLIGDGEGGFHTLLPDIGTGNQPVALVVARLDDDELPDFAVVHRFDRSVGLYANQLGARSDLNGSNRVEGFDLIDIGLMAGATVGEPRYERRADVDLDGVIGGDDLSHVGDRFGQLIRDASPLRATILDGGATTGVALTQLEPDGELLKVEVRVPPGAGLEPAFADFAVTIDPLDGRQILEPVGEERGEFFAGTTHGFLLTDTTIPGRVGVTVLRLPLSNAPGGAPGVVTLFFRPRDEGTTRMALEPFGYDDPGLYDKDEMLVGPAFGGSVEVRVDKVDSIAPGRRIGVAPEAIDFGPVSSGTTVRRALRLLNRGFSALTISSVTSSQPDRLTTFFGGPLAISPFGSVDVPVEFAAGHEGTFGARLLIECDDPARPNVVVPVEAQVEGDPG